MSGVAADGAIPWPEIRFAPLSDAVREASREEAFARRPAEGPVWVFAYGSLMWRPCFEAAERRTGTIAGYRRSFCFWTMVSRGTPDRPGLGLGLEEAAAARCHGVVYRLAEATLDADLVALWDREMFGGVYRPHWVDVVLDQPDGAGRSATPALTFVAAPDHPQYCPPLTLGQRAEIIAGAAGKDGHCADYLEDTVRHLADFGAVEADIAALCEKVRALRAGAEKPASF
ncbi:MAG: gamma-glutamylcyclotransferase [Bauldia litoralis]